MKSMMKKNRLSFVLIIPGIVLSISLQGQITKNQQISHIKSLINDQAEYAIPGSGSIQDSYPQLINHYYWDVTTIWMPDYNRFLTYNTQGNILTSMKVDVNTGDTNDRIVYTYDIAQMPTEELHQLWVNGDWENDMRILYVYEEHGNLSIMLQQMWQGGNWVSSNGYKITYTYDVNNNIIEEIMQFWDANLSVWVNFTRQLLSYDFNGYLVEYVVQGWDSVLNTWYSTSKHIYTINTGGVVTEAILQQWDDVSSLWVNYERHINIVWHNWTGNYNDSEFESKTFLNWSNGVWVNYYRINFTYDATGGWVKLQENYFNGNWNNATRETYTCNEHGHFIFSSVEYWNNSAWVMDFGNKDLLTYTNNDLTQKISQMWDHITQQWVNMVKENYSDFYYTQGFDPNLLSDDKLNLYPNPNNGVLNVELKELGSEKISLEIIDPDGRRIYCRDINSADWPVYQIDLSDYPHGIYFVKLFGSRGVRVGKLILQ